MFKLQKKRQTTLFRRTIESKTPFRLRKGFFSSHSYRETSGNKLQVGLLSMVHLQMCVRAFSGQDRQKWEGERFK